MSSDGQSALIAICGTKMESENPVWLGEYVWEESPLDGGPLKAGPLPAEVLSMFRPQHCLLCGITTANMQTAYTHYESKGHFKKVTHHMREKFNALGSLKTNKEKFIPVNCDICNVELTSRIVYLQHYDGKQHSKNMKKRGFKPPVAEEVPPGESVPNPSTSDPDVPPPPLKLGDYVCALCNVTTATKNQMQVHNNGSRHMKNVAKLADGELRDFYNKNGNCEPMDNDEVEGAPKNSNVSDQPSGQTRRPTESQASGQMPHSDQSQGDYNGGYGPPGPVDPSVVQPFPQQMPYGSYPQYPTMPYDYNSWGQSNMYPGYNNGQSYNGQYGPGPYGQQYPPYGYPQGPSPDYYNQQQYNAGQQQYNPGQQWQQYNQGPQQQHYSQGHYDYHNNSHQQNQSRPNPSPKDPRRQSRNREPPKEPEVNETPLPDGVHVKALAVFPFIKQMADSGDGPPGVDGPPGIDKDEFSNPPAPFLDDAVVEDESRKVLNKVEPKSPPRTLLDIIRENAKKSKRAKEDAEKAKVSEETVPEAGADLPPIPGLDIAPTEGKPTIITWSEGNNKEGESDAKDDSPPGEDKMLSGGVVPPPPHPLNPPIHFLPESPESEPPPPIKNPSPTPKTAFPQPESSVSPTQSQPQVSENSTPYYSQPRSVNSSTSHTQSHASGNLQPHYSHPPVPSNAYSQPAMVNSHPSYSQMPPAQSYPQAPVKSQPAYPQVSTYGATFISNPPVSYSQGTPTNYPSMYSQIPAETPQSYAPVPTPTPLPQPVPQPIQSSRPTPPPVPPLPTEPANPLVVQQPENTPSDVLQAVDDNAGKEDDPSKSASSKPKINSFFRRAAEKMFKEAKEKKMKEEAKKTENNSPKDPELAKKSREPGRDPIVIVPPSSGPKSEETAHIPAVPGTGNLIKARALESVSETDNDVGSEPGEIVDKKPKIEKIVEKAELTVTSTEAETPKSEKSKFDFGSKKASESRRKRSFRVRRSSASRSRSRSRSPKRRGRRRSRSWSPSPEKSPVGYYQRNTFQSYYGNDTSYWRNDRSQFRSYDDWHGDNNDRHVRRREERDEFGREKKWKEEKKREDRRKKKRKSRKRSRSSSVSPPPKPLKEPKPLEIKKKLPSPIPLPVAKPERPKPQESNISIDQKPVTVSLMQRLKGSLPTTLEKPAELFPKKDVPAKFVEEVKNTVEVRDILIRPEVDSDEAREVEKEEQEILKKVALIKKKLLEKEDEKPVKTKKRKKEKSKRKKKKRKSSSSSDSDSSSSDSSSSSSSSSSSTSSSSSASAGSEPKSKRIVESLLTKLSRQAATGDTPGFDLSMLPGLVKKSKKKDGPKKKKKKDKKRKKKKKDKKKGPDPPLPVLSAFITPEGAYHCKFCNLTTSAGSAFLEHLISEKHKLMCKLISTAK